MTIATATGTALVSRAGNRSQRWAVAQIIDYLRGTPGTVVKVTQHRDGYVTTVTEYLKPWTGSRQTATGIEQVTNHTRVRVSATARPGVDN
jgi:hypothetical protein